MTTTPTVLLVHGAFADAGSWAPVLELLEAAGVAAQAVANPLRGLSTDSEYVASVASQVEGPVVLVGHSYGGPVITRAGTLAPNAAALVLVASFGLDRGQTVFDSVAGFPEPLLNGALEPHAFPGSDAPELYIARDRFAEVFAADLPAARSAVLAVSQRPVAAAAFQEPLDVEPAWRNLPSYVLVTTEDNAIDPSSQRAAAERLGATAVEVAASHAVALSHPDAVADLVLTAVRALS